MATSRPRTRDRARVAGPDELEVRPRQPHRTAGRRGPRAAGPSATAPVSDLPEPDSPISPTRSPRPIREAHVGDEVAVGDHATPRPRTSMTASRRVGGVAGHGRSSAVIQTRVEVVAQTVAEQVEPEHGDRDRDARDRCTAGARRTAAPGDSCSIRPHDGVRRRGAEPRNDSAASASTAMAKATDACTMTRGPTFGSTCLRPMANGRRPAARAARTYSDRITWSEPRPHQPHEARHGGDPDRHHGDQGAAAVDRAEHDRQQQRGEREQQVVAPHQRLARPARRHRRDDPQRYADDAAPRPRRTRRTAWSARP